MGSRTPVVRSFDLRKVCDFSTKKATKALLGSLTLALGNLFGESDVRK